MTAIRDLRPAALDRPARLPTLQASIDMLRRPRTNASGLTARSSINRLYGVLSVGLTERLIELKSRMTGAVIAVDGHIAVATRERIRF